MVLGVRENESVTRDNVLKNHTVAGKDLMRHSTLINAYVFAPIRNFSLDMVWDYLLSEKSPWGNDNHELNKLYQDSSSGECPLVVDKSIKDSAGSCGNSRFGCWSCTVVQEDKALNGFILSGADWMRPLLEYRNWLSSIRDDRSMRMKYRMSGQIYFNVLKPEKKDENLLIIPKKNYREKEWIKVVDENRAYRTNEKNEVLKELTIIGRDQLKDYLVEQQIDLGKAEDPSVLVRLEENQYSVLGLGAFTLEARKEILKKLLEVQKNLVHPSDPNYELITEEELRVIRRYWLDDGDWEDSLPKLFHEVMGYGLNWEYDDRPLFDSEQLTDLENLSKKHGVDFKVLKKLIALEKQYSGYKIRRGLMTDIEKALKQDYLHI